jgi:hypothetical protein
LLLNIIGNEFWFASKLATRIPQTNTFIFNPSAPHPYNTTKDSRNLLPPSIPGRNHPNGLSKSNGSARGFGVGAKWRTGRRRPLPNNHRQSASNAGPGRLHGTQSPKRSTLYEAWSTYEPSVFNEYWRSNSHRNDVSRRCGGTECFCNDEVRLCGGCLDAWKCLKCTQGVCLLD